eukprot:TRINITY_DN25798_c0_g2_i2.p1 TRINITY_DN25798_c0_g2~~TRINITY_DN25798_c0_g2_i2.p1  ORF type:complete len:357 (-),score=36.34 TRINITY_DN25798_c0_g2_i2:105-1175(-)
MNVFFALDSLPMGTSNIVQEGLDALDIVALTSGNRRLRYRTCCCQEDGTKLLKLTTFVASLASSDVFSSFVQRAHLESLAILQISANIIVIKEVVGFICVRRHQFRGLKTLELNVSLQQGYATICDSWVKPLAVCVGASLLSLDELALPRINLTRGACTILRTSCTNRTRPLRLRLHGAQLSEKAWRELLHCAPGNVLRQNPVDVATEVIPSLLLSIEVLHGDCPFGSGFARGSFLTEVRVTSMPDPPMSRRSREELDSKKQSLERQLMAMFDVPVELRSDEAVRSQMFEEHQMMWEDFRSDKRRRRRYIEAYDEFMDHERMLTHLSFTKEFFKRQRLCADLSSLCWKLEFGWATA